MKYLSVRNLAKYQHYRERRPIWIKLYQTTLEDVEFTCLPDASKAHALLLLLIASRYDNRIPHDARWIGHAIHATDAVDLDALIATGFLVEAEEVRDASEPASTPIAKRKRVATPKRREKREQKKGKTSASGDAGSSTAGDSPSDPPAPKRAGAPTWVTPFADAWRERYGGPMPIGPSVKALKPLVDEWGADETARRWAHYLTATEGAFASASRFAATFGEYNTARAAKPISGARVQDEARVRAEELWPLYVRAGFISAVPDKTRVERFAAQMVETLVAGSADACIAELKRAKPWTLGGIQNDAFAIDQIAQRLRAPIAAAVA